MLKEKSQTRELEGIQLGNKEQLTHQLFVDDTGIFITATEDNFHSVRQVINSYERISSACLNVLKQISCYYAIFLRARFRSGCVRWVVKLLSTGKSPHILDALLDMASML